MSSIGNPFIRGFQFPRVVRTLFITYEDDCPPVWRPLHPSQAHLPDKDVERFPCSIAKDFAIINEGQEVPEQLDAQCETTGIVRAVVYAITANDFDGRPVHVADTYSEEAAQDVVRRLTFDTGFYSRCFEISSAHITEEARRYLAELADIATPPGFLFSAFPIPNSPAVGVKLISTPWTDSHLKDMDEITAEQLRQEHRDKGMPDSLANALHLAGLADIRILIFDADAPALEGLPLYDW
ncbi:ABC transporter substrate-binding protein [Luteimonas sp. XNQY3]|nr:ABC transporter substrate-binding protein [Luteimonas sp. XNQY3]MCD9008060.1 ABC transporter substrate-binding protein [Luteimonas sp. XNQY3]